MLAVLRKSCCQASCLTLTLKELNCLRGEGISGFLAVIRFKFSLAYTLRTFKYCCLAYRSHWGINKDWFCEHFIFAVQLMQYFCLTFSFSVQEIISWKQAIFDFKSLISTEVYLECHGTFTFWSSHESADWPLRI